MSVKRADYKHDRSGSMIQIASSNMLSIVIFTLSTRWHWQNKHGLKISSKEIIHTTGFTVTIIHSGVFFIYFFSPSYSKPRFLQFSTWLLSLELLQYYSFPFFLWFSEVLILVMKLK